MYDRIDALDRLAQVPNALNDPRVQAALLARLEADHNADPRERNEDWAGDYYAKLLSFVVAVYRRHPSERALVLLVNGYYNEESAFAKWLANQRPALPLFLQNLNHTDFNRRGQAAYLLALMVRHELDRRSTGGPGYRSRLSDVDIESIRSRVRAMVDSETHAMARQQALAALGVCGESRDVARLHGIAADVFADESTRKAALAAADMIKGRSVPDSGSSRPQAR